MVGKLYGKGRMQDNLGPRSESNDLRLIEPLGSIRVVVGVAADGVILVLPSAGRGAVLALDVLGAELAVADWGDCAVDWRGARRARRFSQAAQAVQRLPRLGSP